MVSRDVCPNENKSAESDSVKISPEVYHAETNGRDLSPNPITRRRHRYRPPVARVDIDQRNPVAEGIPGEGERAHMSRNIEIVLAQVVTDADLSHAADTADLLRRRIHRRLVYHWDPVPNDKEHFATTIVAPVRFPPPPPQYQDFLPG